MRTPLPRWKIAVFTAIMIAIPLSLPALGLLGYYGWQKLRSGVVYCGGFGQLDGEIGWVLKPGVESCFGMRDPLTGEEYFTSRIITNADGFRAPDKDRPTPVGGVVAIGDSNTFGYGVDYADSYPGHLEAILGEPVANLGVPAYGIAQTELLLERHVGRLRPRAIALFDIGMWLRSVCRGNTRPTGQLRPCYWRDPASGRLEFITPQPGLVDDQAERGIYPGGFMTAGQNTWSYFLVSRPVIKVKELLARVGLWGEVNLDYDHGEDMAPFVAAAALEHLARTAARAGAALVVIDPTDSFQAGMQALPGELRATVVRMGSAEWQREVLEPSRGLPDRLRHVPKDGHYAGGINRLIAEAVARRL